MRTAPGLQHLTVLLLLVAGSALPAVAETLRCEPVYPVFCGNIHVGCAGRSSVPTTGFSVNIATDDVRVVFDDGENWAAHAPEEKGERVIQPSDLSDWIRIDAKDRFSMRIYRKNKALMAFGQCRTLP